MIDHDGGVKAEAVMLVVVLAVMMTAPMEAVEVEKTPLQRDEGDCRVGPSLRVEGQPLKVSLLAYVTFSDNLSFGLLFPGLDPYKDHDIVSFNSTGGTYTVWDGKENKTPLTFPRLIPEGWNTFRVTADERGVEVVLVQGLDTTTLFTLPPLRHAPDTLYAEGRVARCSRVTPAWEVGAGESKSVVLHLPGVDGRHQLVEVNGGGWEGGAPNLTFPFATSPKTITVAANTTFKITSSLEGAHVHFNVSKVAKNGGGDGNGDEVVMNGNMPINTHSLTLEVVGGRGGDDSTTNTTTLVRLWRSSLHTKSNSESESVSLSTDYRNVCIVLGVLLGLGLLMGVIICALSKEGHTPLFSRLVRCLTEGGKSGNTENIVVVNGNAGWFMQWMRQLEYFTTIPLRSTITSRTPVPKSEPMSTEDNVNSPCLSITVDSKRP